MEGKPALLKNIVEHREYCRILKIAHKALELMNEQMRQARFQDIVSAYENCRGGTLMDSTEGTLAAAKEMQYAFLIRAIHPPTTEMYKILDGKTNHEHNLESFVASGANMAEQIAVVAKAIHYATRERDIASEHYEKSTRHLTHDDPL